MASGKAGVISDGRDVLEAVARINGELAGAAEDGEAVLESLRRLQAVPMTFAALEATKVARAVNALRKSASSSEQARELAAGLYWGWKALAFEHLRSVLRSKAPAKAKRPAAGSSARGGKKQRSPDTAAVVKKQRSGQTSDAPSKAEQRPVAARQRVVGNNTVARRPKPAPGPSKPTTTGSNNGGSTPATATAKAAANKRASPPSVTSVTASKAKLPAEPPKPSNSPIAGKRKEAPTSFDEASLERAKKRLHERYQEAMAVKEKRTIQVIGAPGKTKAQQQRPVVVGRRQLQCTPAAGTEKGTL